MSTQNSSAAKTSHPWSKDALLAKAQLYASEMQSHSREDWQFGLLSTFVLEFVARAALANISPTLLAEAKDSNNLYFALGRIPTAQKFIPRSIEISSVMSRLRETVPTFTSELEGFTALHLNRRNEELHTGRTPFSSISTSWLAHFYETLTVLLATVNEGLAVLVGKDETAIAEKLISASKDESAKAVAKAISAHKTVWSAKENAEKEKLIRQASAWAIRQDGHRVVCPACTNDALVVGGPVSEPIRKLNGDLIIETQEYLPEKFECVACQLKISGLSQLSASGLGGTYKATFTYDAAEYYAVEKDDYSGYEDDNNEP